jgi:hypothetical protein
MSVTINGTGNTITPVTVNTTGSVNGITPQASNMQPFNRIINGAMTIDQRNAGAAVTVTGVGGKFGVDRFQIFRANGYTDTASTTQQVSDAPTGSGFIKSLKYTNAAAQNPTGAMYSLISYGVEGNIIGDLGWGTASAQAVTLSFWVKISITGTFGGSFRSSDAGLSYAISFAYNTANAWQLITATIPGPTTGVFNTDNSTGFSVNWDLGVGASLSISATGAWQSANALGLTNGTKLNATAGATYQITGVQLEAGSTASPFAHEFVGDTLRKCQRYYEASATNFQTCSMFNGRVVTGSQYWAINQFKVEKRASPTMVLTNGTNSSFGATPSLEGSNTQGYREGRYATGSGDGAYYFTFWTADAEL